MLGQPRTAGRVRVRVRVRVGAKVRVRVGAKVRVGVEIRVRVGVSAAAHRRAHSGTPQAGLPPSLQAALGGGRRRGRRARLCRRLLRLGERRLGRAKG